MIQGYRTYDFTTMADLLEITQSATMTFLCDKYMVSEWDSQVKKGDLDDAGK